MMFWLGFVVGVLAVFAFWIVADYMMLFLPDRKKGRGVLLDVLRSQNIQLAKLAAKGPAFFNPLEVMAAEGVRDRILKDLGMAPDGSFLPDSTRDGAKEKE